MIHKKKSQKKFIYVYERRKRKGKSKGSMRKRKFRGKSQSTVCKHISVFLDFLLLNVWISLFAFLNAIDVGDRRVRAHLRLLYTAQISIPFPLRSTLSLLEHALEPTTFDTVETSIENGFLLSFFFIPFDLRSWNIISFVWFYWNRDMPTMVSECVKTSVPTSAAMIKKIGNSF